MGIMQWDLLQRLYATVDGTLPSLQLLLFLNGEKGKCLTLEQRRRMRRKELPIYR
jgi:hypothetical protein